MCVRCAGFPYRLFSLLLPEYRTHDHAAELLAAPPCMLDDMSRQLLHHFNAPASLCTDQDLLQLLAASAMAAQTTTFSTERLHSGNARRARARTHTNLPPIEAVSLPHAAACTPSFLRSAPKATAKPAQTAKPAKRGRPCASKETPEVGRRRKRHRGGPEDNDKSVAHRRGGGGAWRAYVHHQVQHLKRPAEFATLGQEYRSLPPEQMQWYQTLGRQG